MAAEKVSKLLTGNKKLLERTSKMFDDVIDLGKELGESSLKELKSSRKKWKRMPKATKDKLTEEVMGDGLKAAINDSLENAPRKLKPVQITDEEILLKNREKLIKNNRQRTSDLREKYKNVNSSRVKGVEKTEPAKLTSEMKKIRKQQRKLEDVVDSGVVDEAIHNARKQDLESAFSSSVFNEYQVKNKVDADTLKMRDLKSNILKGVSSEKTSQPTGINFDKNSLAMKVAGYGVGGALVFSLANNRGQQSNEQLYGQR